LGRNDQETPLRGIDILGKKVLILGEAGSGKTRLAAKLFQELAMLISPEEITVIDLAPRKVGGIGGKLTDYVEISSDVRYLSPKNVYTPRLAGRSFEQVLHYAQSNRENMEPLLNKFIQNPTRVLIINDVTLYLHLGKLETVLSCLRLANTFLATAYYGSKLANDLGTGISANERQLVDKLARFLDLTVKIDQLETKNRKWQP
jgi:energy-coupling factor transporter ATP-binding protein EcfA2